MKQRTLILRTICLLGALILAASCRPSSTFYVEPNGPPEYQLGWQDGCDSGLSAGSTFLYKIMYGHKKRHEFAGNAMYQSGWSDASAYCRFALGNSMSKDPIWGN